MRRKLIIVGVIGLVIGLFIIDYDIMGIPVITVTALITTILGLVGKRKEHPLPQVKIPQQLNCTNCGNPINPGFKFCSNCGVINTYNTTEPKSLPESPQSVHLQTVNVSLLGNTGRASKGSWILLSSNEETLQK